MGAEFLFLLPRETPHETLVGFLAPFYIGVLLNYLLWGIQITQSFYYYKTFRKTDKAWIKISVAVLFVVDFIESVTVTQACWIFLVDGWGDLNKVTYHLGWGFYATPLVDALVASIVHFFYAQKIWNLLDAPLSYIGTALVILLSLVQFTGGAGSSIYFISTHMNLLEFGRIRTWAIVWLVTAALTDIVITVLMSWKLSKSRTGFKTTDDILSKLIRITVETGFATALVQIVDIIVYLLWDLKSYHIVFAFLGPKVYSNSMMALLNSRKPRNTTGDAQIWSQERTTSDGIQIHTTRTDIMDSYELDAKLRAKGVAAVSRPPADRWVVQTEGA